MIEEEKRPATLEDKDCDSEHDSAMQLDASYQQQSLDREEPKK